MKRLLPLVFVALTLQSVSATELYIGMKLGQSATILEGYPCFDTVANVNASAQMLQNGDNEGFQDLYLQGHITLLEPGWRVKYVDSGPLGGIPTAKLRLESGPASGAACWVPATANGLVGAAH